MSPSIGIGAIGESYSIHADYHPVLVYHLDETQFDNERHAARIRASSNLTSNLTLNLADRYLFTEDTTEDPFFGEEPDFGAQLEPGLRGTSDSSRNLATIDLAYAFGDRDELEARYENTVLNFDTAAAADFMRHRPGVGLDYWFTYAVGIEADYDYTIYDFDQEPGLPPDPADQLKAHEAKLRGVFEPSPQTSLSVAGGIATRDFQDDEGDFNVLEASGGFEHFFSHDLLLTARAGVFRKDDAGELTGATWAASIRKDFERGWISLAGERKWDDIYFGVFRQGIGFRESTGAEISVGFLITEGIGLDWNGSFWDSEVQGQQDFDTWRTDAGLEIALTNWLDLGARYAYLSRDSDSEPIPGQPEPDLESNRVTIDLTAVETFRW